MSIARHTLYNVAGAAVPLAVSLVTVPLYLSAIGLERFGVLSIGWLLLGYFGLFDLGLGRATAQRIATLADAASAERSRVFWTALWLNLAFGIGGAVLLVPVGYLAFDAISGLEGPLAAEARMAVPWLAASLPVATLSGVLSGALQGRERFLAINAVGGLGTVLMSVAPLLVAILVGPELDRLVATALVARLFTSMLLFFNCRRALPLERPARPDRTLVRGLLGFGGWVTVTGIVGPLLASFDRFAIGALAGAASVAHYVVPFNLVSRVSILPQSLSSALFPRFASSRPNDGDRLRQDSLLATALAMTPVVLIGLALVEPFLVLWLGPALAAPSAPVAHILLAGFWVNAAAHVPLAALQGGGRPDLVAKAHLAELLPYAALLFGALWAFGIEGAALAWSLRVTADAILLFGLDRKLASACRRLAFPGALVVSATAIAYACPPDGPLRWILFAPVGVLAAIWWLRSVPADWLRRGRPSILHRTAP
jgi:O-antigen/teichoic acid export membrane protein